MDQSLCNCLNLSILYIYSMALLHFGTFFCVLLNHSTLLHLTLKVPGSLKRKYKKHFLPRLLCFLLLVSYISSILFLISSFLLSHWGAQHLQEASHL